MEFLEKQKEDALDGYVKRYQTKTGGQGIEIVCGIRMRKPPCFPEVTELKIGEHVEEIVIPNRMFPNVRKVISNSSSFLSGEYLIQKAGLKILLNTFCRRKSETINLLGVQKIGAFAFDGCESLDLQGTSHICDCDKNAFTGSAFEKQPFVNGVKMADSILVDVDKDADVIILPDE